MLTEIKKNPIRYLNAVNDVLLRIQGGLRTQDLNQIEVDLLENRFGQNWFQYLGYDKLKPHKEPKFNTSIK